VSRRDERLLRLLLSVRDPLARIELALEGSSSPPDAQLGPEIHAALAEADARLEAALRLLRDDDAKRERPVDCREVLVELMERLAAPLAARGVGLELATPTAPVPGDPILLRRALLCLLRTSAAWAGGAASVRVEFSADPQRSGVQALVRGPRVSFGARDSEAAERFALAVGAEFVSAPAADDAVSLALWLPESVPA
jgi:signal transduction histidine kinase